MGRPARYAIYYLPREDSPLARFGAAWLGYDAALGEPRAPSPEIASAADEALRSQVTEVPARYGFHATLKAPFRLLEDCTRDDLLAAAERFASTWRGFTLPRLELAAIGRFLALVPGRFSCEVHAIANACMLALDRFRAPLTELERAKRQREKPTLRQQVYLEQRGYPYVLDDFRFHMTLTGPLPEDRRAFVRSLLAPLVAPLSEPPQQVLDLCVVAEPEGGGPFRLVKRFALLPPLG